MNASNIISMNVLVAHPDVLRWFLWSWKPVSSTKWNTSLTNIFNMMLTTPIDVTITNTTITIFEGYTMDVNTSPPIVKALFNELTLCKDTYFKKIENNAIFRNIICSGCLLNKQLERSIDRIGWATWSIYWIIKLESGRFFIIKDALMVALRDVDCNRPVPEGDFMPKAPWIEDRPRTVKGIYDRLKQPIYHECFV
jgi:hypothetical protein